MQLRFRSKLALLVGVSGLAMVLLIALAALTAEREELELERIEATYLPLLELGPAVKADMERLRRAMQDAAAAADESALEEATRARDDLAARLRAARAVLPAEEVPVLLVRLDRYYDTALDVTRRLIAGETGEHVIDVTRSMQLRQQQLMSSLEEATSFDRSRLADAFARLRATRERAAGLKIGVAVACLVVVLVMSLWIGRRMLGSLEELSEGFARFGAGELTRPIGVLSDDEVGAVARSANVMARNLHELAAQRERAGWLTAGQAGLSRELEGPLSPVEVSQRALRYLMRHVGAPVGVIYEVTDRDELVLRDAHGLADSWLKVQRRPAHGLLERVRESGEVLLLRELPDSYLKVSSALGAAAPRVVMIVPIAHLGRVGAVLELGLLGDAPEAARELLEAVRGTIAVALHVATTRLAMEQLLRETQEQAQRLTAQEEELRSVNDELTAQQQELWAANEALVRQTEELSAQREELATRNGDLEAARKNLQHQTERLELVSKYKSQFLSNMSHELRTPLNSMLILSDILGRNEQGNLSDKQAEFAATIHAAGKDLLNLINQILDLAKIEAGKLEVRSEEVPVREMIAHLTRIYEPMASAKGLVLSSDLDASTPASLVSDRGRIEQILTNLIGNAIKFTEQGSVRVEVRSAGAGVAFRVSDTGAGISAAHRQRIFDAFEQVDGGSQRRHGGTGLGLAIARNLAVLLGGELEVSSEEGQGSTFTLTLPERLPTVAPRASVAQVDHLAPANANAEPPPRDAQPLPSSGLSLLIVEDELPFAERLAELASEHGLSVLLAKDGETALRLARVHQPRGIVLDVRLPDIDGYEVLERLRARPETAHIPVHFVSSADEEGKAHALGALGYLRKPASREELASVIHRLAPASDRPRRVLVVEDDSALGGSLVSLLSQQDMSAACAHGGREALRMLRAEPFDCMILDLGLPDIDGLAILDEMQRDEVLSGVPVVVHTGRALSRAETRKLETYTETIVLKGQGSVERVLDEVRLFLSHLEPARSAAAKSSAGPDVQLRGKKVLVADDDMRTVYALSALLRGKGLEVLLADNGRTAVDLLGEEPDVDAVIMDIMMPEMDGYEAMREIRQNPRFRQLPIIALTAKAMKDDRLRCVEAGASDYMPKPIDGSRLLSVLHAWLATG
jgi:CheY-like chemotaxis protein